VFAIRNLRLGALLIVLLFGISPLASAAEPQPSEAEKQEEIHLGHQLNPVSVVPFALLLLSIAVLPLAAGHWWEKNLNKGIVALALALPVVAYLAVVFGHDGVHELLHAAREYISFIVLLGSLFVISGCIHVQGSLSGTPLVNTGMLAFGAVLANLVGTTGASVLLIRPLLQANRSRQNKTHVFVFFIFVVSNCGGLLTPLGDPPLFLGFLNGVPFGWTLQLLPQWAVVNGLLLVLFNFWDQVVLNREERTRAGSQLEEVMQHQPLRVLGMHNGLFLLGIVFTIFAAGQGLGNGGASWPFGVQEGLMLLLAVASFLLTPSSIRESNRFGFGPIIEVAVLFAGIFVTMTPALLILNVNGAKMGINEPWEFYWASGGLSSFLDNAPTYLTFAATLCGTEGIPLAGRYLETLLALPASSGAAERLAAIACGSVMMGANTYIGNGPNFMVKAIVEENGVRMPSFFGYMLYSGGILIPLFVIVTFLFFR
jgi:Na+/H+ antiporter NhaD/arsenite permease-like protein